MRHDEPRPRDQDTEAFKIIYRGEVLALTPEHIDQYEAAGCPYGRGLDGILFWMKYGCKETGN